MTLQKLVLILGLVAAVITITVFLSDWLDFSIPEPDL